MAKNDLNRELGQFNLNSSQSDLLMNIYENPPRQQAVIATAMSCDPSLLARDLRLMRQQGWIAQTPDPSDKRAKLISITALGQQVADRIGHIKAQWWQDFFAALPDTDPEALLKTLAEMYTQMQRRLG